MISKLNDGTPQLSAEPLSIFAATMVTFPVKSKFAVKLAQAAVGAVASFTIIFALHDEVFPVASVAVQTTLVDPMA